MLTVLPSSLRSNLLKAVPNLRKSAPEGQEFLFENYLGNLKVNINTRFLAERIMWSDRFELPFMRFLERRSPTGWICFDVGANVGAITLALTKYGGPQSHVYAFEPGPPNLDRLRANLALNPEHAARVEVVAAGIGEKPGELRWMEEPGNPGNAMLGSHGTHSVPVITLDDFRRERRLTKLDFIKIDVEGMELEVMTGAKTVLKELRPLLYFETLKRFAHLHEGNSFSRMAKLLVQECGYELKYLDKQGELHPVDIKSLHGYTVAVPTGRV